MSAEAARVWEEKRGKGKKKRVFERKVGVGEEERGRGSKN